MTNDEKVAVGEIRSDKISLEEQQKRDKDLNRFKV